MSLDKGGVIDAFRALLVERRAALLSSSAEAQAGARVDGDHRPATRGERGAVSQQAALAHGLKVRAAELERFIELLGEVPRDTRDRAGPGTVVQVEDADGSVETWAVLPGGAGDRVAGVVVVSPSAPLARALAGKEEGDEVVVRRGGVAVEFEVLEVG